MLKTRPKPLQFRENLSNLAKQVFHKKQPLMMAIIIRKTKTVAMAIITVTVITIRVTTIVMTMTIMITKMMTIMTMTMISFL